MSSVHWLRPDIAGDLVAVAYTTGAAAPREIRIRPELYARLVSQLPAEVRATVTDRHVIGASPGVPLVVDPSLPEFPGFEVVRTQPLTAA
ncbi:MULTISPECIES: hypothetical protein [unclassified Blastococcus]